MSRGIRRTSTRSNLYEGGAGRMLPAYRQGGPILTSMLLRMEGANGSTIFSDSSGVGNQVTAVNSAALSNAQAKFGTVSAAFSVPSTQGSYLEFAYNTALDVTGSDNFSWGMYIYPTTAQAAGARLLTLGGGAVAFNSTNGIHLLFQRLNGGAMELQFWNGTTAEGFNSGTNLAALNQWSHVTFAKSGSTFYIGVNGTVTSTTATFVRPSTNPRLVIGAVFGDGGSGSNCWRGYVDDAWFVKGQAIYTANYTVPARVFPYA